VVFQISSQLTRDRYLNSIKLVQNAVAWSTEELDLLDIRARGTSSRVLAPLSESAQSFWEGLNYAVALLALVVLGVLWNAYRKREEPIELLSPEALAKASKERAS
jgi:ABC-2 type transport system permease protein